jgi:TldD protein
VRLSAQVVARRDGRVETGGDTRGRHQGWELIAADPEQVAAKAARRALTLLDAVDAPTGRLPVVVGNAFGGVLLHEAVGHGLEADAVQKRASVYAGRLGDQLAGSFVTAYDDGSRANEWGSDGIDDEGTPTQRTTVIEDGRLTGYLYDLVTARRDAAQPTGNGRRESFRHLPQPRMTNTFFAPGEATAEELIGEIERGLYAVSFGGGQVEPATGDFVFGVSEGYLIEGGKVGKPCRGATLIGNCLQALGRIDAVANDFDMKTGFCGKGGQRVPVGTGQGHVRISEMTVGGTAV